MFDRTLLDSSLATAPVLKKRQLVIALAAGAVGAALAFLGLPRLLLRAEARELIALSVTAGLFFALSVLMLCYAGADARRLRLNARLWVGVTLFLGGIGFLVYLLYSAAKTGQWRRVTLPLASALEVLLVGALALAPLMTVEGLPKRESVIVISPPPPGLHGTRSASTFVRHAAQVDPRLAPPGVPRLVARVREDIAIDPPPSFGPDTPLPGIGVPNGVQNSVGPLAALPPPPPEHHQAQAQQVTRVQVGGKVSPPRLILQVQPEYPQVAKIARIEGAVRLQAVVSRDGTVEDLKVLSGHPFLVRAAVDAVSRWRYKPTRLNGEPVEVVMEFDVNFKLNN